MDEGGSMEKVIVYCPECESREVKIEDITPVREKFISIDELGTDWKYSVPAVMIYRFMRATCGNCGYTREYSTP